MRGGRTCFVMFLPSCVTPASVVVMADNDVVLLTAQDGPVGVLEHPATSSAVAVRVASVVACVMVCLR